MDIQILSCSRYFTKELKYSNPTQSGIKLTTPTQLKYNSIVGLPLGDKVHSGKLPTKVNRQNQKMKCCEQKIMSLLISSPDTVVL